MTLESDKNKDIGSNGTDISFLLNAPSKPHTKKSEEQETVYLDEEKKLVPNPAQQNKIKDNSSSPVPSTNDKNKKEKSPKSKIKSGSSRQTKKDSISSPHSNYNSSDELGKVVRAGAYYKYYILLNSVKNTKNLVSMSKSELSKLFKTSLSTSKRVISELQARNLIMKKESHSSEQQKSCTYEVLD